MHLISVRFYETGDTRMQNPLLICKKVLFLYIGGEGGGQRIFDVDVEGGSQKLDTFFSYHLWMLVFIIKAISV